MQRKLQGAIKSNIAILFHIAYYSYDLQSQSNFFSSLLVRSENLPESVNDDLDLFVTELQLSIVNFGDIHSYYLPKLSEKEHKLLELKDDNFLKTLLHIDPDVDEETMKRSESKSKFVKSRCRRKTFMITKRTTTETSYQRYLRQMSEDDCQPKQKNRKINNFI